MVEKYWPVSEDAATFRANFVHGTAANGASLEDVASQQKSFVALLVGIAIDKGLLDISKPVTSYIGPGWSSARVSQESIITVRNLLEMNSGLQENMTYGSAPDTQFYYNTPAYAVLKRVLEAASKLSLDFGALAASSSRVFTFTSFGSTEVSAHSPSPTLKSRRLSVASPLSTVLLPAVQVNTNVTGLLRRRNVSAPSAA